MRCSVLLNNVVYLDVFSVNCGDCHEGALSPTLFLLCYTIMYLAFTMVFG